MVNLVLIYHSFPIYGQIPFLYFGLLSFIARETEHSQACCSATGRELMDSSITLMRCLSPFLVDFPPRLSSVAMLVFGIFYSLTPSKFGNRGCKKLLRSFHMDQFVCIFIFERIPSHLKRDLVDNFVLQYFPCRLIIEVANLPSITFLQMMNSQSLGSDCTYFLTLLDSSRFRSFLLTQFIGALRREGSVSSCSRVAFRDYVCFPRTSSIYRCSYFSKWIVVSVSSWKWGKRSEGQAPMILIIYSVPQI